jgi:hypothetical protein
MFMEQMVIHEIEDNCVSLQLQLFGAVHWECSFNYRIIARKIITGNERISYSLL